MKAPRYLLATTLLGLSPLVMPHTTLADQLFNNGDFSDGTNAWWVAGGRMEAEDNAVCVTFDHTGSNPWDIILGHSGMGLAEGAEYQLSFKAWADKETELKALIQHGGPPYTHYIIQDIAVGKQPKEFSFTFTMEHPSDMKGEFHFQMGAQKPATICGTDFSLIGESYSMTRFAEPVRINQVGYFTGGEKIASVANESQQPIFWDLVDSDGELIEAGATQIFGTNPESGEWLHLVDFSFVTEPHRQVRLIVDGKESYPFDIADDIYSQLKHDALSYYYHNRSGVAIEERFVQRPDLARPAGHPEDVVTCFDKTDAQGNKWPGCDFSIDTTGGWYDAGDHGKYVVNSGISTWTLLNLYERSQYLDKPEPFADGSHPIPEAGNGVNDLLSEARWNVEFMLAMQVPQGKKVYAPVGNQLDSLHQLKLSELEAGGMAFHKIADDRWTGKPLSPADSHENRYVGQPSTAATLNLAAVGAQCARIWKDIDGDFAKQCLTAAEQAWQAAKRYPEVYAYDNFTGSGPYDDFNLEDEFYWAAAELYLSTGNKDYLDAVTSSSFFLNTPKGDIQTTGDIFWQQVGPLGTISLAVVPSKLDAKHVKAAREAIIETAEKYAAQVYTQGYRLPYQTEEYPWGSNSNVVNRGIFLAYASDFSGDNRYLQAAAHGMDYLLGRNPQNFSYVSGYGTDALKNPHHRFWAHIVDENYPLVPPGVLSGGPNSINFSDPAAASLKGRCIMQTCYLDDIGAWTLNEVTINWNAPLMWVASVLDEQALAVADK